MKESIALKTSKYFLTSLIALFCILPFIWVVITAMKPDADFFNPDMILPSQFYPGNFQKVWVTANFFTYFLNSVIVSVITTIICLVLSVMTSYGFCRFKIAGEKVFLMAILFTQMFPSVLLALPYYQTLKKLSLIDRIPGLVIVYISFILPFCIWTMKGFFDNMPWELEEAASIDGCNRLQTVLRIILPIAAPGIAATGLFAFIRSWDEFMYANILINTTARKTIQIGVNSLIGEYTTDWGLLMAGAVISCIPIIIFFVYIQKNLIQGLASGSVKG